MLYLNEFLLYTSSDEYNTYIRVVDEKVAVSVQEFVDNNPDWRLYKVWYIKPDNNALIIEVKR